MAYNVKAKLSRAVSDIRCLMAWWLFHAGAWITDAAVHSYRGEKHSWDWKKKDSTHDRR